MGPLKPNDIIETEIVVNNLLALRGRISAAERRYGRHPGSVALVAVSKGQPAATILAAYRAGQRDFGESYLPEALLKQAELADLDITWHFVGALQANKTRQIAGRFAWVHSIDRVKIAERIHEQRPLELPPLNVCLQVNVGAESQKAGIEPAQGSALAERCGSLTRLRLRGLMALPPASEDAEKQRRYFRQLRLIYEELSAKGFPLDTLSMGMSNDLEAAIAEGTTMLRIGTALFGERPRRR